MISVIIPVYNQYPALDVTLWHFERQTTTKSFEVIVVDDASLEYDDSLFEKYKKFNVKHLHNNDNKGRAETRNIGIEQSRGDFLIFCDCDRLPIPNFIDEHIRAIDSGKPILSIGYNSETYESIDKLKTDTINIIRRKSIYYRAISQIYNEDGCTDSHLCWLSAMSGNMALKKSTLENLRFDCDFKDWGFEHFELGLRLWKRNITFYNNVKAENIHIAHARNNGFYKECIDNSYKILRKKHPIKEIEYMKEFVLGRISLQEYEKQIDGGFEWMEGKEKPIKISSFHTNEKFKMKRGHL